MTGKGPKSDQVEQAVKVLIYIEQVAEKLRLKIEKEKTVPDWLQVRLQQVAIQLNMASPYLAQATPKKKFEPSTSGEKK